MKAASTKTTRRATVAAAQAHFGQPAKGKTEKVHVADDYVLGEGKPQYQWVRVICAAITSLLVGCGIAAFFGWMTEALMIGIGVATGSVVAAMAIYYLGIIAMLITAFYTLPKVWDHVASGRTEQALSAGWARVRGWFSREPELAAE